jgi:hypothetical protein
MPRRGETCLACRRAFEVGQTLRAYLFEAPAGYERKDYCGDCRPADELAAMGFWLTRRREPQARKAMAFDKAALLGFFERLENADTPEKRQFRFVLALLLWRRKALKLDDTRKVDGQELWRFSSASGERTYAVVQPDLNEERIEQLSRQLEQALSGEFGETADEQPELAHG